MENLKTGDILICKGKTWISRGIMKITKGKYSHTALVIQVGNLKCIAEGQARGINLKDYKTWLYKWGYTYEIFRHNKNFDKNEISGRAIAKCGETRYDWRTFFGRIPRRLILKNSIDKRTESEKARKMICSEFTAWVWKIRLRGTYEMTPQEQYNYLKISKDWDLIK